MSEETKDKTSFKEIPYILIKGFLMGSADIVPGVSGGTLALILGIYERLLNAIKSLNMRFFKLLLRFKIVEAFKILHLKFLLVLFVGIFAAFAFFTRIVPLQTYMFTDPEIVFGLFFGLILGSIYILVKEVDGFKIKEIVALLLGVLIGFWVVTLVPTDTPDHPLFIFITGAIAITAMILPGISGSYLLLIMRKYDYMLGALGKLGGPDTVEGLSVIVIFAFGAIIGIALFSRLLSWLLNNYHAVTLALLIGFLIGSLYVIWPYQHREYSETISKVEEVEWEAPLVQKLLHEELNTNLPEYKRLKNSILHNNVEAQTVVEVETVKQKMIDSKPFIPGFDEQSEGNTKVWHGIIGIIIGVMLVGGLDWLRAKS